jgi:hypothetical protein
MTTLKRIALYVFELCLGVSWIIIHVFTIIALNEKATNEDWVIGMLAVMLLLSGIAGPAVLLWKIHPFLEKDYNLKPQDQKGKKKKRR